MIFIGDNPNKKGIIQTIKKFIGNICKNITRSKKSAKIECKKWDDIEANERGVYDVDIPKKHSNNKKA